MGTGTLKFYLKKKISVLLNRKEPPIFNTRWQIQKVVGNEIPWGPHVLPDFISRALIINLSYKTTLNTGESEVIEM